jgi:hypothetical protein
MAGFGDLIAGLSTGLADVASVKVIFFCFDFTGERCSSPSSSAASSSELPCIISMRWELIDGSALFPSFATGEIPPWLPRSSKLVVYVVLPRQSSVDPLPASFFLHPASSSPPIS